MLISISLWTATRKTLQRELLLAYRQRGELLNPLIFFTMVITLFPLTLNPSPKLLQTLAPGIIWVAALLACLLSLDRLFQTDAQDGSLEQLLLSPHPLSVLVLTKVFAHWLVTGLPLVILALLLGVMLNLPSSGLNCLVASLALGTPLLSLIGAIGAAFTVRLRHGGMLLALLVLPLYIPILIFGASAVTMASVGLSVTGQLAWLGALLMLGLCLSPVTIAAALRVGID
jgi:heme exporter protein B